MTNVTEGQVLGSEKTIGQIAPGATKACKLGSPSRTRASHGGNDPAYTTTRAFRFPFPTTEPDGPVYP